ncbi:MAG: LytTR family DNA-binding domain-containing protein [Puia sp.]|nr:LytTR family DNA-binding domain-containing protein [Puia sp.]
MNTPIFVRHQGKYMRISLKEIVYIEARKNYSRIVYLNKESLVIPIPLKAWLDILPHEVFVMVHRSYIVGLDYIDKFDKDYIWCKGGEVIRIGEIYRSQLAERVLIYTGAEKWQSLLQHQRKENASIVVL